MKKFLYVFVLLVLLIPTTVYAYLQSYSFSDTCETIKVHVGWDSEYPDANLTIRIDGITRAFVANTQKGTKDYVFNVLGGERFVEIGVGTEATGWDSEGYYPEWISVDSCYQICDMRTPLESVISCGDWEPWVYNPITFQMETARICTETITYVDAIDGVTVCPPADVSTFTEYGSRTPTKAEVLIGTGVPGKGLFTAPGLNKFFNSNSPLLGKPGLLE